MRWAESSAAFNFSGLETSGLADFGGTATAATVRPKSLLLPSLSVAREGARRATCLSNERQQYTALLTYASEHFGLVPIGYAQGNPQYNYVLWDHLAAAGKHWKAWGQIYLAGLITTQKTWYCPSITGPTFHIDTVGEDRWPPGADPGNHSNTHYGMRPYWNWHHSEPYAQLSKIADAQKAWVTDSCTNSDFVDGRHADGINAIYGDGAARWIPRSTFGDIIASYPNDSFSNNAKFLSMWPIFDAN